jgi:hypothetical protein
MFHQLIERELAQLDELRRIIRRAADVEQRLRFGPDIYFNVSVGRWRMATWS